MDYTLVVSYELTCRIWRDFPIRLILLTSETLYHGIIVKVNLNFNPAFEDAEVNRGFVDYSDPFAPIVSVWLPLNEYQYYYDILREENPVFFGYNPVGNTFDQYGSSYIDQFELITHIEPTGEGSREPQLTQSALRLERTIAMPRDVRERFGNREQTGEY